MLDCIEQQRIISMSLPVASGVLARERPLLSGELLRVAGALAAGAECGLTAAG